MDETLPEKINIGVSVQAKVAKTPLVLSGAVNSDGLQRLSGTLLLNGRLGELLTEALPGAPKGVVEFFSSVLATIKALSLEYQREGDTATVAFETRLAAGTHAAAVFRIAKTLATPAEPDGGGFEIALILQLKSAADSDDPISLLLGTISIEEIKLAYGPKQDWSISACIAVGKEKYRFPALPAPLPKANDGLPPPPDERPDEGMKPASNPGESGFLKWISVMKTVGPLEVRRIGVEWKDEKLGLLLDAGVRLSVLSVGLNGFAVRTRLTEINPEFGIDGMEIGFRNAAVEISGAFLRREIEKDVQGNIEKHIQYDGRMLIRTAAFSLAAIGSYASIKQKDAEHPSFFLYGALTLGEGAGIGNSVLKITGLALGFGINRCVVAPAIEDVRSFALVSLVMGDSDAPQSLEALVKPFETSIGDYFGCIGLRFTIVETIDAFALAILQVGNGVEFTLLGMARLILPKPVGGVPVPPLCFIELQMKAAVRPKAGIISIEARLTDSSWVLTPDCKLTGGFALYIWFAGPYAGDFVLTLGGYHPRFKPPSHYPVVPRLALTWRVSSNLMIKGEMYFAVTPSAIMAGGRLEATFDIGWIRAWFLAYADFLIQWQPIHYEVDIAISMRIEVDLWLFKIRLDVGVSLHLWGPPAGGIATVNLSLVSFAITFGEPRQLPAPVSSWKEFGARFLDTAGSESLWDAPNKMPIPGPCICRPGLAAGRMLQPEKEDKKQAIAPEQPGTWFVRGDELALSAATAIPATELILGTLSDAAALKGVDTGRSVSTPDAIDLKDAHSIKTNEQIGIFPMKVDKFVSTLRITIVSVGKNNAVPVPLKGWKFDADVVSVPAGLWNPDKDEDLSLSSKLIPGCINGIKDLKPPEGRKIGKVQVDPESSPVKALQKKTATLTDLKQNVVKAGAPTGNGETWPQVSSSILEALKAMEFTDLVDETPGTAAPFRSLRTAPLTRKP